MKFHFFREIKPILNDENSYLFDEIFVNGEFSFDNDLIVDQLNMYTGFDKDEAILEANKFGCKISNNENVIVPANLSFYIAKGSNSESEMTISRADSLGYDLQYIEPNTYINGELSEYGNKIKDFASEFGLNFDNAYSCLKKLEKSFGVTILK